MYGTPMVPTDVNSISPILGTPYFTLISLNLSLVINNSVAISFPFLIKSIQELNEKVEKQQIIINQLQNN